jgi:hypothetical protein
MMFLTQIAKENKAKIIVFEKVARPFTTHLRCMQDTFDIFAWFMCSTNADEFKDTFGDLFTKVDFQGQKLVSEKPIDKQWFRALRTVHKDFYEFIKARHPDILKWTGSNSN